MTNDNIDFAGEVNCPLLPLPAGAHDLYTNQVPRVRQGRL